MPNNVAASMTASIVIDKSDLLAQILKGLSEGQKELENNKLELYFDFSDSKNKAEFEKVIQRYKKELSSNDFVIKIKNQGIEETIKSLDKLLDVIKSIASGKGFGIGSGNGIGNSTVDEKQLKTVIDLFTKMESHLSSIKKVFSDVGDGGEFSPLLKTLESIENSINNVRKATSKIKLNVGIDLGNNTSEKMNQKISQSTSRQLEAYRNLFSAMKGTGKTTKEMLKFFEPDDASATELIGAYQGIIKRAEEKFKVGNGNAYKKLLGSTYDDLKKEIKNANAQLSRAENKRSENGILGDLFGSQDLSGVIEQLNTIVSKLDEISSSAKGFTETFKNGLNVNASVEEIQKLTNRVKELEGELNKIKTPTTSPSVNESNISSGRKDAFPDSSTETKPETEGMGQVEKATEEAIQAKKDFATANEGVQSSIDGSENPLKLEAELMEQIAKSAREAADAKKEFVEANKQVKDSAEGSNNDLVGGHSENAEPSGVKKYKKKGYKAHDTGNHDNERKVSSKAELGKALKDLQSEIIASIDESTSFVKEVTDFYDSKDNLVKTQMKVGDKSGSMRTYTTSYSMDEDGSATAWTSHIETQKIAEQARQEAKAIQAEWDKNLKLIQDYMDAVTKLNNLKAKDKGTGSQASQIELQTENVDKLKQVAFEARQNLSSMQAENPDIIAWKQWVDMMELFDQASKGSAESAAKLKDILDNIETPSLDKYENKLASYQTKTGGYNATIARFNDGGWTSDKYLKNVQAVKDAVKKYEDLLNDIKAKGGIASDEDIQNLDDYEKKIKETIATVTNMSAAEKGYNFVSGQKELDKIHKLLNENSRMSSEAKAKIKAYYKEIESGNPSMSLDRIHGEIMKIYNAEVEAGRAGRSFFDTLKNSGFHQLAAQMAGMFGFYDVINVIKQAASTVTELNTQITELAKVSEQSSKQIYADFDSYADIAKEVRGTISDTIAATADWSKNGYSIPDSKQLAEISQLYKNVGDGIDIDTANESLISTLKGFQLEADQAEHIVDVFNEVSNNEAISSGGIGEALQRSAASFNAANTSLEQSVALVTATNSVLQDPEKVGNMWKTKFYCLNVQQCA